MVLLVMIVMVVMMGVYGFNAFLAGNFGCRFKTAMTSRLLIFAL